MGRGGGTVNKLDESGSCNSGGGPCPDMTGGSFTNKREDCPVPAGTSTISTLELTKLRNEDSIGTGICGGCPRLEGGNGIKLIIDVGNGIGGKLVRSPSSAKNLHSGFTVNKGHVGHRKEA